MSGFELFLIIFVCLLLYKILRTGKYYWEKKGVVFEKPLPLIGNLGEVLLRRKTLGDKISECYTKFNERFFGIWIFKEPQLVIKCPELIKHVLIKDFNNFYDRNVACNEVADNITANMMFFMTNPRWKNIRTKTTPIFTSGKMKYIYPQIHNIAKDMVSFISSKHGRVLEAKDIAQKYSTDVICSSAFGVDAYSFQDKETPFTEVGKTIFGISLQNTISSITYFCRSSLVDTFKIKFLNAGSAKFLSETFMEIVEKRESGDNGRRDLVDILLQLKKEHNLKDHEVVAQAVQFFLAGYETTSSTISFALYELALHKHMQEKLRQEISANADDNGDIPYAALHDMEYLDKVVSETLRKYPILPFLGRVCMNDYKIPGSDVVIEKNTPIVISVLGLQYDPKYFPNPQEFDPERFSEENVKSRPACCYLPFGDGQRNCIGQRMGLVSTKLAVTHIVKNFQVEISSETNVPLKFNPTTFFLYVDGGIYVTFNKI